jgi:hypothetical protein
MGHISQFQNRISPNPSLDLDEDLAISQYWDLTSPYQDHVSWLCHPVFAESGDLVEDVNCRARI